MGGLSDTKRQLLEALSLSSRYAFLFADAPRLLNAGILLYGPPGCGKSYLVQAIAREFRINMVQVRGPELLDKYIGSSEQRVREVFERAAARRPCVLFFDEIDSLVPKRGSGSTSVTDRIVNQFLTYLDGVENTREGIVIVAATSRPDMIDKAVVRPGRIDRALYCGWPKSEEREEILRIYMQRLGV